MKNFLLPLILLFPCFMTAQNNQAQIDSLRNVVVTQHGIEKVDT